tara:strand:+ start:2786 stop:3298 length:513 start_codon:yes stop_codon:yes gene_type:complete
MTLTEPSEVSVTTEDCYTLDTMVYPSSFTDMCEDKAFGHLVLEYADECKMAGMPQPNWAREMYLNMEGIGIVQCLVLRDMDLNMVGFSVLLCTVVPHYSELVVTAESLFVTKRHRKGGGGLRIIKAIEGHAKNIGAVGVLLSAPAEGSLAKVAPRIGYQHASEVFFKGLL